MDLVGTMLLFILAVFLICALRVGSNDDTINLINQLIEENEELKENINMTIKTIDNFMAEKTSSCNLGDLQFLKELLESGKDDNN